MFPSESVSAPSGFNVSADLPIDLKSKAARLLPEIKNMITKKQNKNYLEKYLHNFPDSGSQSNSVITNEQVST